MTTTTCRLFLATTLLGCVVALTIESPRTGAMAYGYLRPLVLPLPVVAAWPTLGPPEPVEGQDYLRFTTPSGVVTFARRSGPELFWRRVQAVAWCESSHRADVISANGLYYGLLQVDPVIHARLIASMGYTSADLLLAEPNIRVGAAIYQRNRGWGPWPVCGEEQR